MPIDFMTNVELVVKEIRVLLETKLSLELPPKFYVNLVSYLKAQNGPLKSIPSKSIN